MAQQDFFTTIKRSFADVPVDKANGNAIRTTEFLEASEGLVSLFGTCSILSFVVCLW
jgi:hypothetical protein